MFALVENVIVPIVPLIISVVAARCLLCGPPKHKRVLTGAGGRTEGLVRGVTGGLGARNCVVLLEAQCHGTVSRSLDLQRGAGEQDVVGKHDMAVQLGIHASTQVDGSCGEGTQALVHCCHRPSWS